MKTLRHPLDFQLLETGEKIYCIHNGESRSYRFVCMHPIKSMQDTHFIVVSDASHTESKVFKVGDDRVWKGGTYSSQIIGETMVSQLNKNIESVSRVYLTPKPN